MRINYENSLEHGLEEYFDPNGTISMRINYKNGIKHGLYEEFYYKNTKTTKEYVNNIY